MIKQISKTGAHNLSLTACGLGYYLGSSIQRNFDFYWPLQIKFKVFFIIYFLSATEERIDLRRVLIWKELRIWWWREKERLKSSKNATKSKSIQKTGDWMGHKQHWRIPFISFFLFLFYCTFPLLLWRKIKIKKFEFLNNVLIKKSSGCNLEITHHTCLFGGCALCKDTRSAQIPLRKAHKHAF